MRLCRLLAYLACCACLLFGVVGATFDLGACDGLAIKAHSLTFLNASQYFEVDVHNAAVSLSSAPIDPFFGKLTDARLTASPPSACRAQFDALPQQFECDFYTHPSADTGFAFADGSSGDGVGYWSHPGGDASKPMQMTLRPGVYCPRITALNSSYFWVRAITMEPGNIVLDAGGDPDAQFVFQSDVLMHFEGTNVLLANNASDSNVLWHGRKSVSIGVGETELPTSTAGIYATGTQCGIWMRKTNLIGHLLSGCNIQLEGASEIHTDAFYTDPPPPPSDSSSSFFESRAGIAVIATGSAVAVSAVAAGLWIRAHSLATDVAAQASDVKPQKQKTQNKNKKKKSKSHEHKNKDKQRLIDSVKSSDQAAVSDLMQMPALALSRARIVQVCID